MKIKMAAIAVMPYASRLLAGLQQTAASLAAVRFPAVTVMITVSESCTFMAVSIEADGVVRLPETAGFT